MMKVMQVALLNGFKIAGQGFVMPGPRSFRVLHEQVKISKSVVKFRGRRMGNQLLIKRLRFLEPALGS